jgi:hypothetical protein
MDTSDLMKLSVLGYNFADWVKQFKKAFKQPDGTYDYMAYFSQLNNPVGFFLLDGRLSVDEANAFLNSVVTSTINSIEVVGGKRQKGGCGPTCKMFILMFIFLLFMSSIDSSLAGISQDKLNDFKRKNPGVNLEKIPKPEGKKGLIWDTPPSDLEMAEWNSALNLQNELEKLISAAKSEAKSEEDQKIFAHKEKLVEMSNKAKEVSGQQAIISKAIDAAKGSGEVLAKLAGEKIDALVEFANKMEFQSIRADKYVQQAINLMAEKTLTNLYSVGVTAACALLGLYYFSTTRKNMKITLLQVQYFWPQIQAGLERGDIKQITNPKTGRIEYYTTPAIADTLARIQDNTQLITMGYEGPPAAALGLPAALGPNVAGPAPGFGPRQAAPYDYAAPPRGPPRGLPSAEGGRRKTRKLRKSKKMRNSKRR